VIYILALWAMLFFSGVIIGRGICRRHGLFVATLLFLLAWQRH
jgi:hypothetical protein